MPPSSPADRSDADAARHDTGKTPPDILTREPRSTEQTHELANNAVLGAHYQPPETQIEHDEISSLTPELNPFQQAKSEAESQDEWRSLPRKEVILRRDAPESCSSEINDLSEALEGRLSLSQQPSISADQIRELSTRSFSRNAVYGNYGAQYSQEAPTRKGRCFRLVSFGAGDTVVHAGDNCEYDNLVHCFVDDCGTKQPYISLLL